MTETPWWQRAVVYQVYPRSFADTSGNGVGDLPGITAHLDYLASTLGVDAVWISPFYPSPMDDFGYDVADYCAVDPLFGTIDDFDHLVADAHRRGLKVIVDWVPNHTSDRHPWFVESRSDRTNSKRDWYVWADPRPDGSLPNNWLSVFGGPAWEWDEATGQYYLHSFLESQPDLDWRHPEVKVAMFETLRFWMRRGVDGFRIDVAHHLMKDPELRDNPLAAAGGTAYFKDLGEYERFDHVHAKGHADVHELFRELRGVTEEFDDRFLVGEIHVWDWDEWSAYYGADLDELHMPYNFSLLYVPWDADEVRRRVESVEGAVPPGGWPNYVLGNHDEARLAGRFGPERARVAAMLLLTLRGSPTIYYGDELGMPQVDIAPDDQQDPWGLRVPGQGRDGCRTPMPWTAEPGHGFTTPGTHPWLPFSSTANLHNVATQLEQPHSILQLYRRLLDLRRREAALHSGHYTSRDDGPGGVFMFERHVEPARFVVALNFTGEGQDVVLDGAEIVLSTHLDRDGRPTESIRLRPNEGVIARLD